MHCDFAPIRKITAQVRAGALSPRDLVDACLDRIERIESDLRAWTLVDADSARRQADAIAARIRQGDVSGRLLGVPLGIKDIVDVLGMPTEAGSPLRKGWMAKRDAPLVARLRAEGAIVLGKTVTTEFACFDPPVTRNPWRLSQTPGGSSSGSAAAVAAGMCVAAIGSQTGGSIIRPASFCGVAGLKPRWGAVSLEGVVPISHHLDHAGPIARCVADLREMFLALCDLPAQGRAHASSPWRFVVLEDFLGLAEESARDAALKAVNALMQAGAVVSRQSLPMPLDEVLPAHRRIMAAEAAEYHRPLFADHREQYGPHVCSLIEEGNALLAVDYAEALATQRAFRSALANAFDPCDILVAPSTVSPAPGRESTGDPRLNSPWSFAGCPAVTLPCGLSRDGLPLGLQLATIQGDELSLLDAAAWCEETLGFQDRPAI